MAHMGKWPHVGRLPDIVPNIADFTMFIPGCVLGSDDFALEDSKVCG